MGILLSFGKDGRAIGFGMIVPLVEHGLRKYCEGHLVAGKLVWKPCQSALEKLVSWLSVDDFPPYSATNHMYDLIPLDRLELPELEFVYQLMCDFRKEGTCIDGVSYDSPLNEIQIRQLDEVIPATKLYLEARRNGAEVQWGFSV